MCMAKVVDNTFVKKDPIISEFNEHEHFLRIVVEAFAEYVLEIAQTGCDYHNPTHFLRMVEPNICFSYICYFLFLFGFKYVQMRKAIRENNSKLLDLIWRENLASARSDLANKTQYSQMTVSLIYWGTVLVYANRCTPHFTIRALCAGLRHMLDGIYPLRCSTNGSRSVSFHT